MSSRPTSTLMAGGPDTSTSISASFQSLLDALTPALRLLEQHGYIREVVVEPRKGPGRKPSPLYMVNPLWRHEAEVAP